MGKDLGEKKERKVLQRAIWGKRDVKDLWKRKRSREKKKDLRERERTGETET